MSVGKRKDNRDKSDLSASVVPYRSKLTKYRWAFVVNDGQQALVTMTPCETEAKAYELMEEFFRDEK